MEATIDRPVIRALGAYQAQAAGDHFLVGSTIAITVGITPHTNDSQVTVRPHLKIYEGSILSGHGSLIQQIDYPEIVLYPEVATGISFIHVVTAGTIDRRDVNFFMEYYSRNTGEWKSGPSKEWDDNWYRELYSYSFDVAQPVPSQA